MAKRLAPNEDRIVVRADEDKDEYSNVIDPVTKQVALIKPTTAKEKPQYGTVVAVGPGKGDPEKFDGRFIPMPFQVNDKVMYGKYAGVAVQFEGEELLIMRASDVLARIDDDEIH